MDILIFIKTHSCAIQDQSARGDSCLLVKLARAWEHHFSDPTADPTPNIHAENPTAECRTRPQKLADAERALALAPQSQWQGKAKHSSQSHIPSIPQEQDQTVHHFSPLYVKAKNLFF